MKGSARYLEILRNPALRRGAALGSRVFFADYYFNLSTPPHIKRWLTDHARYQLIEGPRNHGKTYCRSIIVPLHDICFNRNSRILLIGRKAGEAEKRLKVCKANLEKNERLLNDFGLFKTSEKSWTDHAIYVDRPNLMEKDPTIEAVGIGGAITGGRFSRVVIDDPTDDKNVNNARIRKEMVDWLFGTVFELLDPDGHIDVILTRKHYQDLAYTLRQKPSFFVLHDKAIQRYPEHFEIIHKMVNGQLMPVGVHIEGDPGDVLWKERWPMEKLLLKRHAMGTVLFDRENQNIIRSEESSLFPMEHLEAAKERGKHLGWIDQETAKSMGYILFQAWDPAFLDDPRKAEHTDSDYTVGITVGYKPETGERMLCKGLRFRGKSPYKAVEIIKQEAAIYSERVAVAVENNSMGKFHELEIRKSSDLPLSKHTTDSRKGDVSIGIPAMSALFENGKWTLPYGTPEAREFVDILTAELHGLGDEAHDDTVLALWIAECAIRKWQRRIRTVSSTGRPIIKRPASLRRS